MEIQRFDALARQLSQGESRRRLLGLFGGTALGGLIAAGLDSDSEAKKRKKKKKCKGCTECQSCKKGKCKPKPEGSACNSGFCASGSCQCFTGFRSCQGRCIPEANCCTSADCPASSGQTCQSFACACPPGQELSGGVCGTRPTCTGPDYTCDDDSDCCSDTCLGGVFACSCSTTGERCRTDDDCCALPPNCRGFVCRAT